MIASYQIGKIEPFEKPSQRAMYVEIVKFPTFYCRKIWRFDSLFKHFSECVRWCKNVRTFHLTLLDTSTRPKCLLAEPSRRSGGPRASCSQMSSQLAFLPACMLPRFEKRNNRTLSCFEPSFCLLSVSLLKFHDRK